MADSSEPEVQVQMLSQPRFLAAVRALVGTMAQRLGFNEMQCGQISLAVDEALRRLEKSDPRKGRIVELRYFGGLTSRETAELLGLTQRTVNRDVSFALGWVNREMGCS